MHSVLKLLTGSVSLYAEAEIVNLELFLQEAKHWITVEYVYAAQQVIFPKIYSPKTFSFFPIVLITSNYANVIVENRRKRQPIRFVLGVIRRV